MSEPLITVMMPCYNAAKTLPMALASLLAQTYENWECVFIDDGSTDESSALVAGLCDSRIRSFSLTRNFGRAVARQAALDQARGSYLCFLDADDWYYPEKLASQLAVLRDEKRIVLVSSSYASVDRRGHLAGVHRNPHLSYFPSLRRFDPNLQRLPVSFNASMIRMDIAKAARFSSALRHAEDADWMFKVLWDRDYAVLSEVTYAYNEYATTMPEKTERDYSYQMLMYWLNRKRSPWRACRFIAEMWIKQMVYRVAFRLDLADRLVARRSQVPEAADHHAFDAARLQVIRRLTQMSFETDHRSGLQA